MKTAKFNEVKLSIRLDHETAEALRFVALTTERSQAEALRYSIRMAARALSGRPAPTQPAQEPQPERVH